MTPTTPEQAMFIAGFVSTTPAASNAIYSLAFQIQSLTKERDALAANHKDCVRCLGEALQDTANVSVERDALNAKAEQAQAVEPTTIKTEQVAGAISKHISTPLIQREVIAAAQYIAHRYMRPAPPAPPAGEQIDWHDMYLKQKSEKEAMAAKYEKDIGLLARVEPATGERAEVIKELRLLKFHVGGSIGDIVNRAADMLEADAQEIAGLRDSKDFYRRRVQLLQKWRSKMRDPERTIACDIIANGQTLPPENAGDRYKIPVEAQQVAVPDGCVMVPTETLLDIKNLVNTLATLSLKAERYSIGREIKQAIADMLAAAQGAKP